MSVKIELVRISFDEIKMDEKVPVTEVLAWCKQHEEAGIRTTFDVTDTLSASLFQCILDKDNACRVHKAATALGYSYYFSDIWYIQFTPESDKENPQKIYAFNKIFD